MSSELATDPNDSDQSDPIKEALRTAGLWAPRPDDQEQFPALREALLREITVKAGDKDAVETLIRRAFTILFTQRQRNPLLAVTLYRLKQLTEIPSDRIVKALNDCGYPCSKSWVSKLLKAGKIVIEDPTQLHATASIEALATRSRKKNGSKGKPRAERTQTTASASNSMDAKVLPFSSPEGCPSAVLAEMIDGLEKVRSRANGHSLDIVCRQIDAIVSSLKDLANKMAA